jgi:FecR protein
MTERRQQFDPFAEIDGLLVDLMLGDLADVQVERLNDLLLSDVELRRHAARFLEEDAVLRRQFQVLGRVGDYHSDLPVGVSDAADFVCGPNGMLLTNLADSSESGKVAGTKSSKWHTLWRSGIAAAIAAGIVAVAAFTWLSETGPVGELQPDPSGVVASPVVLAHVVRETSDCEWSLDHHSDAPRSNIFSGDMIRVAKGKMKLNYNNGTVLTLHGPALFEVISEMRGRALLGKLTAKIAKGAEGFSVLTPRATVVDLGTELGIEVDDSGATDVVVFEGSVDLNYTLEEGSAELQRRLFSGEAMRLDAFGTISRIVSISNQRFSDDLSPTSKHEDRPAIISSVRDNIQRETAWNYYEIVRAGMREDARAFVDRQSHEWNGVDATGMPKYLLGCDYVKTFNNDKCRKDIEIVVTLEEPCKLYILFDERIPAPRWLSENFRNTGDKIGIDCGPWKYNGVLSHGVLADVGPGNSIDDLMSVWVREVKTPGPVRLGATETPHDDLNMYGIVAVPLAADE